MYFPILQANEFAKKNPKKVDSKFIGIYQEDEARGQNSSGANPHYSKTSQSRISEEIYT